MLILHTKGVKTGLARIKPLDYLPDGERFVVFGTKGGAPTDAYWCATSSRMRSRRSSSPTVSLRCERWRSPGPADELYARQVEWRPGFAEYKRKTSRRIPVIALEPAG